MRLILAALAIAGMLSSALAHESWISHGGLRNAAGEWCCGEGDCFELGKDDVAVTATD